MTKKYAKYMIGTLAALLVALVILAAYAGHARYVRENPAMRNAPPIDPWAAEDLLGSMSDSQPGLEDDEGSEGVSVIFDTGTLSTPNLIPESQGPAPIMDVTPDAPSNASISSIQDESSGKNIVTVTFLGIDTSEEREKKGMGWRSDAIIVCAVDIGSNEISAITVPRDTRAQIPIRNDKGEIVSYKTDKINSAYAYGGGAKEYGHENALHALSDLLGVRLDYYVSMNMDAIVKLADSVGGVEVTLEEDIDGVGEKGEKVLLKGDKAYNFVRKRHGVGNGSDIERTVRQQQFLRAFALKVKTLKPLEMTPVIMSVMGGDLRTNLSMGQILELSKALSKVDESKINFETIPGHSYKSNKSYYKPDIAGIDEMVESIWG